MGHSLHVHKQEKYRCKTWFLVSQNRIVALLQIKNIMTQQNLCVYMARMIILLLSFQSVL